MQVSKLHTGGGEQGFCKGQCLSWCMTEEAHSRLGGLAAIQIDVYPQSIAMYEAQGYLRSFGPWTIV